MQRRVRSTRAVDLGRASLDVVRRRGERGPGAQAAERVEVAIDTGRYATLGAIAKQGDAPLFLADVGHDVLGRIGGRRGAHVGDEVEQRRVGFVADRADDRSAALGGGPNHRLIGEGQQVFDAATAAGDHDDIDLGIGVECA